MAVADDGSAARAMRGRPAQLLHFSEDPHIARFVPHVPATNPEQELEPPGGRPQDPVRGVVETLEHA